MSDVPEGPSCEYDARVLIRTNMNQFPTECASLISVNIVLVNCPSVVHSVFSFLV